MSRTNPDAREEILARLAVIAGTVVPPANVFRNTLDIPETNRPAIVILDADEDVDDRSFGRNRPPNGLLVVGMTPEIFILDEAPSEQIGALLNRHRSRFLKAVLTDGPLVELSHEGDIRYEGFATGLAVGRSMEGESGIRIRIFYVFRPNSVP